MTSKKIILSGSKILDEITGDYIPYSNNKELLELDIEQVFPCKDQPRKTFKENELKELAHSINTHGLLQPILVQRKNDFYEIIAGERRWQASKLAGLKTITAIIKEYDDYKSNLVTLIENIQRENLNAFEEANALENLLKKFNLTHQELAETIGKSRTAVTNLLRLLKLEPEVQDMLKSEALEMGHARALLSLTGKLQIEAALHIIQKNLSVREAEKYIKISLNSKQFSGKNIAILEEAHLWQEKISAVLHSKVDLKVNAIGKGKVVIYVNSLEDIKKLIQNITFSEKG